MALATSLDHLAEDFGPKRSKTQRAVAQIRHPRPSAVALPNSLHRSPVALRPATVMDIVKRLPSALDDARDEAAEGRLADDITETARRQTRNLLRADPDGRRPHGRLAGRQ
jgi:hypothetical protein